MSLKDDVEYLKEHTAFDNRWCDEDACACSLKRVCDFVSMVLIIKEKCGEHRDGIEVSCFECEMFDKCKGKCYFEQPPVNWDDGIVRRWLFGNDAKNR